MQGVRSIMFGVVVALSCPSIWAANRLYLECDGLIVNSTDNQIRVLADTDDDVYSFSVRLLYNNSRLVVSSVELGSDVAALSPGFSETSIAGDRIVHSVVFDTIDPVTEHLDAGTSLELLIFTFDVTDGPPIQGPLIFHPDSALVDGAGRDLPACVNRFPPSYASLSSPDKVTRTSFASAGSMP